MHLNILNMSTAYRFNCVKINLQCGFRLLDPTVHPDTTLKHLTHNEIKGLLKYSEKHQII